MKGPKILIVEGNQDKYFLEGVLKNFFLNNDSDAPKVQLSTHKEFSQKGNGSEIVNAIKNLTPLLFIPEELTHLAFVVDADESFTNKRDIFEGELKERGFYRQPDNNACGDLFKHTDERIKPIGLWIMPNHHDIGAIENLFIDCCSTEHQQCLEKAKSYFNPHPCIDKHQLNSRPLNKAIVYTWLAWQKKPTSGYRLVNETLNPHTEPFKTFLDWIENTFELKRK